MAHTPGPWTIEYETEGGEPYDDGVRIDSLEGPVAFNVIDCSAPLIAAAPELLAALDSIRSSLMELDDDGCGRPGCGWREMDATYVDQLISTSLRRAIDAIAKAEGVTMEGTNGKERSLD
jgi:hypothetical protein